MHTAEPVTRRQPESWRARFARLRREHRSLDHRAVALARYVNYQGYQYAASITYFSVLSLVPLVMVALSVVSFVLAGQPALLGQLRQAIGHAIPPALDGEVGTQ